MKGIALVLISLVVGSLADPALPVSQDAVPETRLVTGQITGLIDDLAQQIRDAGLDPYKRDWSDSFELPVPVLFSAEGFVKELEFTGLSNIVVDHINFSLILRRLTINIVLPAVNLSIGGSKVGAIVFGDEYTGSLSGSLVIRQPRIWARCTVNVGVITGISIRNLQIEFSLGGIQSNLEVDVNGEDMSQRINTFLGSTVPATLNQFSNEINELLVIVAQQVIDENLN